MNENAPKCSRTKCSRPCKLKSNGSYAKECINCLNRYKTRYRKKTNDEAMAYHDNLNQINHDRNLEIEAQHDYILQEKFERRKRGKVFD